MEFFSLRLLEESQVTSPSVFAEVNRFLTLMMTCERKTMKGFEKHRKCFTVA